MKFVNIYKLLYQFQLSKSSSIKVLVVGAYLNKNPKAWICRAYTFRMKVKNEFIP